MIKERHFDAMVDGFYRAATGACGWNEALVPVQTAFGARFAAIQSVEVGSGRMVQLAHGGPDLEPGVLDYVRRWHAVDPRRDLMLRNPEQVVGRWWHCDEHLDNKAVARSPFYRHFLQAHDSRHLSTTAALVSYDVMTWFVFELPAGRGPLAPDERHMAERLGRHVVQALRAYERLRRLVARALAGHVLLEAFSYPMWLVGADRFVYFANAAARAIASDEVVVPMAQRLALANDHADQRLGECLHVLGNGRHGQRFVVDVRRLRSDPPAWLHLQAMVPARVLGVFGDQPQVLATLFDPRQMRELDPFALGDLFGMTPTEGRVAVLLAEGLTAQAIAARLGCGVSTVRTHLRKVLAKLGATRLTDAVRLLRQGGALWSLPAHSKSTFTA